MTLARPLSLALLIITACAQLGRHPSPPVADTTLLPKDPRTGATCAAGQPALQVDTGAPITTRQLFTRGGAYQGQPIVTNHYDTGNPRGGGTYYWDGASVATHNGGTVIGLAAVGRWQRVFSGAVDATWFGATGDGSTDDTSAIQAAINYAISSNIREVFLPSGIYRICKTLQLGKPGTFTSVSLSGQGNNYPGKAASPGTYILATHSDSPALNVQGAREIWIKKLGIGGPLKSWIQGNSLGVFDQTAHHDTDAVDWDSTDPSIAKNAESRYAPLCGVAIDGWSGTQPTPSYPTSDLAYGQPNSSNVLVEDVMIEGFNAGVCVHPSNSNLQGDYTRLNRCLIQYCKYGLSVGNTQSRNVEVSNTNFAFFYTAITTNTHGPQTGKLGSTITNCDFGSGINLFKLGSSSVYGPLKFQSCHSEGLWRLGDVMHSTTSEQSLSFDGCEWGFQAQTALRGVPATVLANSGSSIASVKFVGGSLTDYPSALSFALDGVEFDGTSTYSKLGIGATISKAYLASFQNATCGGVIFPRLVTDAPNRIAFNAYNIDTLAQATHMIASAGTKVQTDRHYGVPAWIQSAAPAQSSTKDALPQVRTSSVWSKSGLKISFVQSASKPGELTVTWPHLTAAAAELSGQAPGDVILDDATGMVFVIRARDASAAPAYTVVAEAQNNYQLSSKAYTTVTPFSKTIGNLYFLNARVYTPSYPLLADGSASSAVLTSVGRDDGFATFMDNDIHGDASAGDRVLVDPFVDAWLTQPSTMIVALDSKARTMTLAGPPARTLSRKRLPWFVRAPVANARSR